VAIFGSETEVTEPVNRAGLSDELRVRIGRTYANTDSDVPIWPFPGHSLYGPGGPYRFAPKGERTVEEAVLHAISRATKFIYIEDQYLFCMKISDALKNALPNIKKLIILITDSGNAADQVQTCQRRKDFIDNLTGGVQPPTGKVIVCQNKPGSPRVPFVHSKTFIFDDRFAIVGSANLNRRGYTHDSEQNAGIHHANTAKRFYFAHELRMHLWAKLLEKKKPIDLVDPIASSVHWTNPIGNIITYTVNQKDPQTGNTFWDKVQTLRPFPDLIWDNGIDPDGS